MDKRLARVFKETFGVTVDDVEKMGKQELRDLYERAMENEEIKAIEAADTTKMGETQESIDAAHILDWIWEKSAKFRKHQVA